MKKAVLMVTGLILLGVAAFWRYELAPGWTQRIPPGWKWEATFVGIEAVPDEATGNFPEKSNTSIYERSIQIIDEIKRPQAVRLEDHYTMRDPATHKKVFEYIYRAQVDPWTGAHLEPKYRNDVFVFPRGVEKKTYSLRNNLLKGVPLQFQKEEKVEDILTYVFAYNGRVEYTEAYGGTAEYPGVKIESGQEVRCADDQFRFKAWVEPVTGEMLKAEENCASGDYIYEIATGKQLTPILRWGGVTAGDDVVARAEYIRRERAKLLWLSCYCPLILLTAGLLSVALGMMTIRHPQEA